GDGTFQPAQDILTGQTVSDVVAGDFNGTGNLDLIVSTNTGVSELRGNGDGTFQAPILITAQGGKLAVSGFNNDCSRDLIVPNSPANLSLGTADGTFQLSQPAHNTLASKTDLVAVALDCTGTVDLDVTGGSSTGVGVVLGNGDGTFQGPVLLPGFGFT